MGSTVPPINIAIIGGGISGLALAAGLSKKPHLNVHIYEGVSEYNDVGAGLALHKNAIGAMSFIGPEVRKAYFDKAINIGEDEDEEMATEVILAHGPHTGQQVAELGRAKGRKSVSRADLLAGFLEIIPKENISFGKKLALVEETDSDTPNSKVHLTFQDGSKVQTDCLLGADGIHSIVRSHLLGPTHPATLPKNHDRWQVFRTLVSTSEAITTHGINPRWVKTVPIMTGPQGHVNVIPLNKGTRLSAGIAVRGVATASSSPSSPTLDPTLYSTYHPQAQSLISMISSPSTPKTTWSIGDHDHAPYYYKSRIAMLGDAAHASLPFAGNGAAQALEDAAVLDHLFSRVKSPSQIKAALAAYDAVRRKRSQDVVELSRMFGRVYAHCSDGEIYGEEEGGGKGTPLVQDPERLRAFFAQAAAFTNDFDLEKQNDEAVEVYGRLVRGRSRSCGQGLGN